MGVLTYRGALILALFSIFIWALWGAFNNLLYPEIGLALKRTTGGTLPSFTLCPYDYSSNEVSKKWKLVNGKNAFDDILSILPSMENFFEISTTVAR